MTKRNKKSNVSRAPQQVINIKSIPQTEIKMMEGSTKTSTDKINTKKIIMRRKLIRSKYTQILCQSYVRIGSIQTVGDISLLGSNLGISRSIPENISKAMNIVADEVENNVGAPVSNADEIEIPLMDSVSE